MTMILLSGEAAPTDAVRGDYRQASVARGAAILAASLAGCIWLIVVAVRHADTDVAVGSATVFKVPRERAPAPPVTEGGAATPR